MTAAALRISPRTIVLNVTLQCPLRCGHCCYRSDMTMLGRLSLDEAQVAIDEAARLGTIEQVQFVGGDPFLATDLMAGALKYAKKYGLTGAATTSAFWARSRKRALEVLSPLTKVGLAELVISYDDAHAEFVPMRNIEFAVEAARELGLQIYVAVTINADATLTADVIREKLNIWGDNPKEKVYEVVVNATGRAADADVGDRAKERNADHRVYRGACHSVLQNIQITHDARVLPCCGVLPHNENMVLGDLKRGDQVDDVVAAAYRDPLWAWIALEGPIELLVQATAGTEHPLAAEQFDGICSACDLLFNSPRLLELAREALAKKSAELENQIAILAGLDMWRAPVRLSKEI